MYSCKSRIGFNDFIGRMTEMEKYIKFLETQLKTKNEESILLILILTFCSAFWVKISDRSSNLWLAELGGKSGSVPTKSQELERLVAAVFPQIKLHHITVVCKEPYDSSVSLTLTFMNRKEISWKKNKQRRYSRRKMWEYKHHKEILQSKHTNSRC